VVRGDKGNGGQQDYQTETLTKESMAILYEEAKVMVEELIDDAKAKAEKILSNAKTKAEEIKAIAQKKAEEIKADAYEEGFQKGKDEGLLHVQELKTQANMVIEKAYMEKEKILGGMEKEIVDFTIKIAEKVIRKEIDNNPQIVEFIVKDLLTLVQDANQVTVKLSNADYENLASQKEGFKAILNYGGLNIESDCTLTKGDCIVVSETGIVVAKIDDQLAKLHDILREVTHGD